jgi:hypothetical protein
MKRAEKNEMTKGEEKRKKEISFCVYNVVASR